MTTPDDRQAVARRIDRRLTAAALTANMTGAVVVFVFVFFLIPLGGSFADSQARANLAAFSGYLPVSAVVGVLWGMRVSRGCREWLSSSRPADDQVRVALLRLPLRQMRVNATLWVGALLLFSALNLLYEPLTVLDIGSSILLGGIATCGVSYLLSERYLRPAVSLAMVDAAEPPQQVLGVRPRLILAWLLGSGIPMAGLLLGVLVPERLHPPIGPAGVAFLAVVGLLVGLIAISTAAGAVADPVRSVARAMASVGSGDLTVSVPVYDASEVGQLQNGFNAMVAGLRERDRVRDLYGRQVGDEVAALAVEQGARLGGELRDVAVLFVDVIGSTALAQTTDPQAVVRRLNGFFALVIEAVSARGGWVNKFEGDAALCVFGAPTERPSARTDALAAGRALAEALQQAGMPAAIGVAAGQVVAGNVGAESRFEYTVIGDPVNVAARLTELAKTEPGCLLADAAVLAHVDADEAARWVAGAQVVLRGRAGAVRLAHPR